METLGETEGPVLFFGDLEVCSDDVADEVGGDAAAAHGFVDGGGVEASFEGGVALEGELGESDALDGEKLVKVTGR